MFSLLRSLWEVFLHGFRKRVTIQYPDEKAVLSPRYRGRIVLTRDPDGGERCVACNLCAVVCPTDCISLQATEDEHGRRYPGFLPNQLLALHFLRLLRRSLSDICHPTHTRFRNG